MKGLRSDLRKLAERVRQLAENLYDDLRYLAEEPKDAIWDFCFYVRHSLRRDNIRDLYEEVVYRARRIKLRSVIEVAGVIAALWVVSIFLGVSADGRADLEAYIGSVEMGVSHTHEEVVWLLENAATLQARIDSIARLAHPQVIMCN